MFFKGQRSIRAVTSRSRHNPWLVVGGGGWQMSLILQRLLKYAQWLPREQLPWHRRDRSSLQQRFSPSCPVSKLTAERSVGGLIGTRILQGWWAALCQKDPNCWRPRGGIMITSQALCPEPLGMFTWERPPWTPWSISFYFQTGNDLGLQLQVYMCHVFFSAALKGTWPKGSCLFSCLLCHMTFPALPRLHAVLWIISEDVHPELTSHLPSAGCWRSQG